MSDKNEEETKSETLAGKLETALQKFIDDNKIAEMICLVKHPTEDDVAIFYRGHFYEATKILGNVYMKFRDKIQKELP